MDALPPELLLIILEYAGAPSLYPLICTSQAFRRVYQRYWEQIQENLAVDLCRKPSLVDRAIVLHIVGGSMTCHVHGDGAQTVPYWVLSPGPRLRQYVNDCIQARTLSALAQDVSSLTDWLTDPARSPLASQHPRDEIVTALWTIQASVGLVSYKNIQATGLRNLRPATVELVLRHHVSYEHRCNFGHDDDADLFAFQLYRLSTSSLLRSLPYERLLAIWDVVWEIWRACRALARHGLRPHPHSLMSRFGTETSGRHLFEPFRTPLKRGVGGQNYVMSRTLYSLLLVEEHKRTYRLSPGDRKAYRALCASGGLSKKAVRKALGDLEYVKAYLESFRPLLGLSSTSIPVCELVGGFDAQPLGPKGDRLAEWLAVIECENERVSREVPAELA
ncbi:hypothetical protein LTR53_005858 [Teratosphaeriaceae sp. CCFEE 6253]|nr:hypothetical protein LTR53_005858 [Teratosphaeriaceae sp. CCFEE 6253]